MEDYKSTTENQEFTTNQSNQENNGIPTKNCTKHAMHIVMYSILFIAVAVLYVLHFTTPKTEAFVPTPFTGDPGSGEVVYVNLDTINANYELINILGEDIESEMASH